MEVDICRSTYKPLGNPHVLKELFELILQKARKIKGPFEQSFFLLVHLSCSQAFEDVNERNSRQSCNIPFIESNLCPLSFTDVARDDYTAALLTIYEKNEVHPLLNLFAWAYSRSCKRYGVIRKSLGEIDVKNQGLSEQGTVHRQIDAETATGPVKPILVHGVFACRFLSLNLDSDVEIPLAPSVLAEGSLALLRWYLEPWDRTSW